MRLTKRQLKRIIREEYSRLKRRGLIRETNYWWKEKGRGANPFSEKQWTEMGKTDAGLEEREAYMDWRFADNPSAYDAGYEEGIEGYKEDLPSYLQQMEAEGYSEDELDDYRRGFEDGLQANI